MERITVGCLVRHRIFDAVGLVVDHRMWDADWGAFGVQFNRPTQTSSGPLITYYVDRADRWVLVSGCDNQ